MITVDRLREVFYYDELTGDFTWKVKVSRKAKIGKVAGHTRKDGYKFIKIDGVVYCAHRLAILYVTGKMPENDVDHKDLNPSNNAYSNLRDVTHIVNLQNQVAPQINSSTGVRGVYWNKNAGKYQAQIKVNKRNIYLGLFSDLADAAQARTDAVLQYHAAVI